MGVVKGKIHAGGVETAAVIADKATHRTCRKCTAGRNQSAVIGFVRRRNRWRGYRQRFRADGRGCTGYRRCAEAVVTRLAAVAAGIDSKTGTARGADLAGTDDVRRVVSQDDATGVQSKRIAGNTATDAAGHAGTGRRSSTVIGLGQGTANTGAGSQGLGSDCYRRMGNVKGRQLVITGQTAGSVRGIRQGDGINVLVPRGNVDITGGCAAVAQCLAADASADGHCTCTQRGRAVVGFCCRQGDCPGGDGAGGVTGQGQRVVAAVVAISHCDCVQRHRFVTGTRVAVAIREGSRGYRIATHAQLTGK